MQIITIVILILSIIMHEVAHGYAAYALGDPTAKLSGRLTLNPIPHLDILGSIIIPGLLVLTSSPILFGWAKPVPYNPYNLKNQRWGEAIVAVAGSATNILLALIFALVIRLGAGVLTPAMISFAAIIVLVNLFLGLFNLIPFPPLDGFTFIRGALPYRLSYGLHQFENSVRMMGPLALIFVLFVFSYILATPFYQFILYLFTLITGASL